MNHESTNQTFPHFSPKISFLIGLGTGLAVMFMIGFFILLGILLKGNNLNATTGKTAPTQANVAPQPTAPAPQPSQGRVGAMAPITDQDWIRGNRNAKISVVEYSDLECPFCKRVHPTMQQIIAAYGDQVNWVYRHFPLTSIHPKASKEAEATECAGELAGNDGFWQYVDRLFEVTPSNNNLDPAELPKIAGDIGLDKAKFEECLNSGKYAKKVQDHSQDAVAAGGTGTPYSIIVAGDQKIPVSGAVPFEQFKAVIDQLLQQQ